MLRHLAAIFCATTLSLVPASSQKPAHDWKIYTNVRFQYAICYPQNLLKPQGESDDGDGQTFTGSRGEQLLVYGQNQYQQTTLSELQQVRTAQLEGQSGKVTYRARQRHSFVLSGRNGKNIFYSKTFLTADQFKTFELTYPAAENARMSEIAKALNICFTDLARTPYIRDPKYTGAD